MRCAIWYHLQLKNVKNTPGGVLFLVKLQATKRITPLYLVFFVFFKFYKSHQIAQSISFQELVLRMCLKPIVIKKGLRSRMN